MPKNFWKWSNGVETSDSKLILEGVVSSEDWWGDGLDITPQAFRDELAKHSGNLTVSLNSPGGDVFAGVSIYNTLSSYDKGDVIIEVNGLAASIASVIAMAGDKIIMLPGSSMMIHKPWSMGIGNADELEKVIEALNSIEDSLVPIYTARTGLKEDRIKEMLADETWLTPQEAVELGFADELVEAKKKVGISDSIKNALNIGQFALSMSATKEAMDKIVDKMKAETETEEVEETNDVTDTTETSDEVVDDAKQDEATDESETEAEQAEETETEEVTETTVEEVNNSVEKDNTMEDKAKDLAQDQVITPNAQAKVEDTEVTKAKDYLKSKKALEDFANVLKANAGKTTEEIKAAWGKICVQNGLTDPDYFLPPEPVVTNIEDAVKTSGIYNALNHTGLDVFKAVWDDTDSEADTSRAGQHNKGDEKAEQVLDFDKRVLRPRYIYKYLVLDKETIREQRSTGALIRFVLNELPVRIIREIERAVVIGDGRGDVDRRVESFISVKSDVVAGNAFASSYTPDTSATNYEKLVRAIAEIETEGAMYLVAKKGFLVDLKLEQNVNGGWIWAPGADVAGALGFAGAFEPTWFTDTTDADYDAYIVVFGSYYTVGDNSIESFTNFKLQTNENEFLQEIYKGGGLVTRKAAVGIEAIGS